MDLRVTWGGEAHTTSLDGQIIYGTLQSLKAFDSLPAISVHPSWKSSPLAEVVPQASEDGTIA
jgi:hypothetical protein